MYNGGSKIRIRDWGWGCDLIDLQRISIFSRVGFDGLPPHGSDYGLHACILREVPGTLLFSYIVPLPEGDTPHRRGYSFMLCYDIEREFKGQLND